MPFFYPKKLSTPLVVGISNDPEACNRALRQPVAFLFLQEAVRVPRSDDLMLPSSKAQDSLISEHRKPYPANIKKNANT